MTEVSETQTYEATGPVLVKAELLAGSVHVVVRDRSTVTVGVHPSEPGDEVDVAAAKRLRVEFGRNTLSIRLPMLTMMSRSALSSHRVGSVDVTVEVPTGSELRASARSARLRVDGRLSDCRFETMDGDIEIEEAGPLRLVTASGDVTVGRATGRTRIASGSGTTVIGDIAGNAHIGQDYGDVRIGTVDGRLRITGVRGDLTVDRLVGVLEAKVLDGRTVVGEVVSGSVTMMATWAHLEVGIRAGTAARLDLRSVTGRIRNLLHGVPGPETTDQIAEITAHTYYGDVVIRRAPEV